VTAKQFLAAVHLRNSAIKHRHFGNRRKMRTAAVGWYLLIKADHSQGKKD